MNRAAFKRAVRRVVTRVAPTRHRPHVAVIADAELVRELCTAPAHVRARAATAALDAMRGVLAQHDNMP